MDYNKKYEDALERCKKAFNFNNLAYSHEEIRERLERVFPELKESESERIIRTLKEIANWGCAKNISVENNVELKDCIAWLEKQGEQKHADKIELKFHSGDFITDGERIFQIKETVWERNNRNDGTTYCESLIVNLRDGVTYTNNTDLKGYHLWTIQDAKDGDVLATEGFVFIFKEIREDKGVGYFCANEKELHEGDDSTFHIAHPNSLMGSINNDFTHYAPATKEQRDLLFQKMKEAGYEWDAEKKELKMAESVQPELPNGEDYGIDSLYHAERILEKTLGEVEGYQSDDGILEHKCAIEAVKRLYKQKPTWSEEDEHILEAIIKEIEANKTAGPEYDEKVYDMFLSWLNSLKERYTWKPSIAQLNALSIVSKGNAPDDIEAIVSLYEQLKKLRGE